jgi:integrase
MLLNRLPEVTQLLTCLASFVEQLHRQIAHLENPTYPGISLPFGVIPKGVTDGMGSRFQQRIEVGRDIAGKPTYRWATGNTLAEFTSAVCRINAEYLNPVSESAPVAIGVKRVLFEDYAQHWYKVFAEPHLEPTVRPVYKSQINKHIIPAFQGRYVDEITTQDVQQFLNDRAHMAKSTVRDQWNKVKQIFASALEDGLITKNPATSTRLFNPATRKEARNVISDENVADIIRNIPTLEEGNDRIFMALLMYTDMRPCEIRGLRWEDIDVENGLIHIERNIVFVHNQPHEKGTKTEAGVRLHPLDPQLLALLEPLGKGGFILQRDGKHAGKPLTEMAQKRMWERIKATIDVHGMIPYEARHTYITAMYAEGVAPKLMQDTAGHANFNTTAKNYIHTQPKQIQKVGEIMRGRYERIGRHVGKEGAKER